MNPELKLNNCRVCDSLLSHSTYIRGEETGNKTELYKCNSCGSYFSKIEFNQQTENDFDSGSIDVYMNRDYVENRVRDILLYLLKNKWIPDKNVDFLDIGCGVGWSLVTAEKYGFNAFDRNTFAYLKDERIAFTSIQEPSKAKGAKVFNLALTNSGEFENNFLINFEDSAWAKIAIDNSFKFSL